MMMMTSIVERRSLCVRFHDSGRSLVDRCWTTSMGQPTSPFILLKFRRLLKTQLFCWVQRRLVTVAFQAPCKYMSFTLLRYSHF